MYSYKYVKKYRVYKDGTVEVIEWLMPIDPKRKGKPILINPKGEKDLGVGPGLSLAA